MPAPVLQFKRGNAGVAGTVPALRPGEPAISLNNFDFFIGIDTSVANNKFFGSHRYWGREDGTNSLKLKLVDKDGSNYVAIKSPDTLAGIVTYTLPGIQGATSTVLTNDGNGNLSWASGSANPVFTGVATFTDTTDNNLGNYDTGAVQIDGGLGVAKNLTVGAGLSVAGESYFIGTATFYGGTLNLGDSDGDNINVAGEFVSNLNPNVDGTYDIGDNATPKRWRHASFSGVGTFATGAVIDAIQIGISGASEINTSSGNLTLDSATGTTIIDDNLEVTGNINCTGNVSVGGTTVTLRGTDVYIENKDIILGYTTSITPNDDTANHAGVAIASTIGSPLASFAASGINTFPDTYKQLMWFKSGTLGFATDAFAFNYGVAVGTTTMADGVRLAVGSGVTVSDTAVTAINFYGNASTADQVKTVDTGNANSTYYVTFVNSNNGSASNETVYTDDGIYYNPGTNTFTTQHALFTGNVDISNNLKVVGVSSANNFISTSTTLQAPTIGDFAGERLRLYDFNSPSNTNYAIGAESNHIWFGVDNYSDTQGFKWYGEETQVMRLGATGNLRIEGDLTIGGNDIKASDGTTAVSISTVTGNVKSAGDLIAGSGYLASANGTRALYMYDTSGDVSFQGKAIVNQIRSSNNASALITLNDLDATFARDVIISGIATVGTGVGITQFSSSVSTGTSTSSVPTSSAIIDYINATDIGIAGDSGTGTVNTTQTLTINGTASEIETSASGQTITIGLPDAVIVGTSLSAPTLRTGTIQSSDTGATAITISTNDVTIADDLTVQGNLYVNGNTTQVNTTSITVEDRTIELGAVDGTTTATTTWDLGVLFNYGDAGTARKSAVVWEHSDSRFKFAKILDADSNGTNANTPQLTVNTFAPIEVAELWVNNSCTGGAQQVIGCVGNELQLQNITIDAGTF